jgi:hypothetical protein
VGSVEKSSVNQGPIVSPPLRLVGLLQLQGACGTPRGCGLLLPNTCGNYLSAYPRRIYQVDLILSTATHLIRWRHGCGSGTLFGLPLGWVDKERLLPTVHQTTRVVSCDVSSCSFLVFVLSCLPDVEQAPGECSDIHQARSTDCQALRARGYLR